MNSQPSRGGKRSASIRDKAPVEALRNLGPKSAAWLSLIGIQTKRQLEALGTVEVCRRLLEADIAITPVMAYAIEGALRDCDWRELPPDIACFLRAEISSMKKGARNRKNKTVPSVE